MNVFILILVFIFMAGWYLMDSPSQNVERHTIEFAARQTAIGSVLTCLAHVHTQAVALDEALQIAERVDIDNDTPCAARYHIETVKICTDGRRISASCVPVRPGQSITNFIISFAPAPEDTGKTLEILAKKFPGSTGFGIITQVGRTLQMIIGNGTTREVPDAIVRELGLAAGQIMYITQYGVAGRAIFTEGGIGGVSACAPGHLRVFRFNRWQCVSRTPARVCTGTTILDPRTGECVPDNSRRPLCVGNQTAVMIDDFWECVNPIMHTECPAGYAAHLNYETMEWICAANPAETRQLRRCDRIHTTRPGVLPGGGTIRVPTAACTECEMPAMNPETCETKCVPDPTKRYSQLCYPGSAGSCENHPSRAFYFVFPDARYVANAIAVLPMLGNIANIPIGMPGRDRMFNCLDCGDRFIDTERSRPPFTAFCQ
ncbi:MAG: hypothetical protein FWE64_01290 [Alphaproteobacteria bacterium]|nr:hypothetical protein [Alphaproteobacteria bacterium]